MVNVEILIDMTSIRVSLRVAVLFMEGILAYYPGVGLEQSSVGTPL